MMAGMTINPAIAVGLWMGGFLLGLSVGGALALWLHRRKHVACIIRPPAYPRAMARRTFRSWLRSMLATTAAAIANNRDHQQ